MATPPMNQLGNIPFAGNALQNVANTPQGQTPGVTPGGNSNWLMNALGGIMGRSAPVSPGIAPASQGSGNMFQQLMGHLIGQSVASSPNNEYIQKAVNEYMKEQKRNQMPPASSQMPQTVLASPRKKAGK